MLEFPGGCGSGGIECFRECVGYVCGKCGRCVGKCCNVAIRKAKMGVEIESRKVAAFVVKIRRNLLYVIYIKGGICLMFVLILSTNIFIIVSLGGVQYDDI